MNLEQISYYVTLAAFGAVVLLWFGFAAIFFLRKKPEASTDASHAPRSWAGLALQGMSFMLVWAIRRTPEFSPIISNQLVVNIVLQVFAVILAAGSVWLAMSAIRELGKQWSLEARLIEDHRLVTTGVYNIVRHPIYTAMLGMLLSTGITLSRWYVVLASVAVFIIGTKIRTTFEERLLRHAFGKEFEDFHEKVPGLIPFVKI